MFVNPSNFGGGGFFKPKDHNTALAILIEPKSIDYEVENNYEGQVTYRDEVTADISVFATQADLEAGTPEVLKSYRVTHAGLTKPLERMLKSEQTAMVATLTQWKGRAWIWNDLTDKVRLKQVEAFYTKREQDVAEAIDAAPDFD